MVSSLNIGNFTNCTEVNGNIEIRADSFKGGATFVKDQLIKHSGVTIKELEENLKNVRKVTGYVVIQQPEGDWLDRNTSMQMKNLNFLKNLQRIDGRTLFE